MVGFWVCFESQANGIFLRDQLMGERHVRGCGPGEGLSPQGGAGLPIPLRFLLFSEGRHLLGVI